MGTLVGMTIYVPLYFEAVHHLSAAESGVALIPQMAATVLWSTICGQLMMHLEHYKRVGLIGVVVAIVSLAILAAAPASLPLWAVLILTFAIGSGLGTMFPISTVCLQNATGAANFFRALMSALVVAVLGAIVLGRLGGAAGAAIETVAKASSVETVGDAFRYVFIACALVLCAGMAFLIAMDERPLRGPGSEAATGPATPIPDEGL
jgi:MFS family permease